VLQATSRLKFQKKLGEEALFSVAADKPQNEQAFRCAQVL
jgi:hypothetical protein